MSALGHSPGLAAAAVSRPVLAWQVGIFWRELAPLARRILRDRPPDIVTVEHDNAAAWVGEIAPQMPSALVLHNIGTHYYASRARAAAGARRLAFTFEARRFRRYHDRWLDRYSALIAVSDWDASSLRSVTRRPVEVVPNGVASDELLPTEPSTEPATVLFTGTLDHPPNSEGIRWFAAEVWPHVLRRRPDARLLVVGRAPPREVRALDGRDRVEVIGPVSTIAPYFDQASVVTAPLLSGGGTRLKILEAFACGRAVVSTSVGCEGLDVVDGEHLLVEDDPGRFAAALLRLLEHRDLRERVAIAGRELATRSYDWRVLGDRHTAILEKVVERRAS
jgi:glycosyltransferase involved in cell wall biosynthesis